MGFVSKNIYMRLEVKSIMKDKKVRYMCMTGIFVSLVFVVTAYLHIPTNNGYVHVGDGFIYLAACLLPCKYAVFVGAGGALLADCLTGFAVWAPGSVIIKALTALLFSRKGNKIINLHNMLALLPAAILCVGGYYLYESLIIGNFIAALPGIPGSLVQALASSIVYVALGVAMDKYDVKKKMLGDYNI